MKFELNVNTIMTALVLGLATWTFSTLQSLDRSMLQLVNRVDRMAQQSFYEDCPYCNHALHAVIEHQRR